MPKKNTLRDEWQAVRRAQAALDSEGPWTSLAEAAVQFDIPVQTLITAANQNRLPALHVPALRGWLVRPSAVEARLGLFGKRGRPPYDDQDIVNGERQCDGCGDWFPVAEITHALTGWLCPRCLKAGAIEQAQRRAK